jgi:Core-2/I-Branching enzyme
MRHHALASGIPDMRIGFVLQTYRSLSQVGRLVDTLNKGSPDNLIVITHSGSRDGLAELTRQHRISHILPAVAGRGQFGLVDSYLSALRWLRRQSLSYDWIVLLSGQDYPIRPLAEFRQVLERSPHDGYFYHFDPLDDGGAGGPIAWSREQCIDRYFFRYACLKDDLSATQRALLRIPRQALALTHRYRLNTSFGLRVGRRAETPFTSDFRLYGGNYWHTIRRECGEALLDFVDENPNVVDYFRHVVLPDESFIQSVLLNAKKFRISASDLRYFDFSNSHLGHSKTLGPTDLESAFASKCYFGRKFDATAHPAILDILDARVLGYSH